MIILAPAGAPGIGVVERGDIMSKHHKNTGGIYRKVWESANGKIPSGYHIHHIDGNPYNNDLSNLICVTAEQHAEIHNSQFAGWASVGGKIGGDKCKQQRLGWFAASKEERLERSKLANSCRNTEQFSNLRKEEYRSGTRKHWTTYYTPEEVSKKISQGDPGKSKRGKVGWNSGKKMTLSNPELARQRKSESALRRSKITCQCCNKQFDPGNYTRHINAKRAV